VKVHDTITVRIGAITIAIAIATAMDGASMGRGEMMMSEEVEMEMGVGVKGTESTTGTEGEKDVGGRKMTLGGIVVMVVLVVVVVRKGIMWEVMTSTGRMRGVTMGMGEKRETVREREADILTGLNRHPMAVASTSMAVAYTTLAPAPGSLVVVDHVEP
jgi:hypothetical protein